MPSIAEFARNTTAARAARNRKGAVNRPNVPNQFSRTPSATPFGAPGTTVTTRAPQRQAFTGPPLPTIDRQQFEQDPVKALTGFSAFTGERAQQEILPRLFGALEEDVALPNIGAFQEFQPGEIPRTVSLLDTLRGVSPELAEKAITPEVMPVDFTEAQFQEAPRFRGAEFQAGPEFQQARFQDAPEFQAAQFQAGPEFRGAQFQAGPEFQASRAITPDVLNDPSFQAFQEQLRTATGRQSEAIANEMARRGILSSGATQEQLRLLGEGASRALASEAGRIASPLIQRSLIAQNIEDPRLRQALLQSEAQRATGFGERQAAAQLGLAEREAGRLTGFGEREAARRGGLGEREAVRRTRFGAEQQALQSALAEREAARRTGFGERQQALQSALEQAEAARRTSFGEREAGRRTAFDVGQEASRQAATTAAIQRALGLATGETGIQQRGADVFADALRRERGLAQSRADLEAGLPAQQEQARLARFGQIQNMINAILTGGQTQSGLGTLASQQESAANRALRERELAQRGELGQQQLTGQAIGSGVNLLARLLTQ